MSLFVDEPGDALDSDIQLRRSVVFVVGVEGKRGDKQSCSFGVLGGKEQAGFGNRKSVPRLTQIIKIESRNHKK